MRKRTSLSIILILIFTLICSSAAFAFMDLPNDENSNKIMQLKEDKIINGINDEHFAPDQEMTAAHAIQMIVKGLDLNLAHFTFIKEPLASDYFTSISDKAWYAESFMIAQVNGVQIPKDIDPNRKITKEEYLHYLHQAMEIKADFVVTKQLIVIEDEAKITNDYSYSIQFMLVTGIAELDREGRIHPKKHVSRADAAVLLYDTIEFVKEHGMSPDTLDPGLGGGELHKDVSMEIEVITIETKPDEGTVIDENAELITETINKVTVSWGEQPHPGYGISIVEIKFASGVATIYYNLSYPLPDRMYPQVIVYPKDITYIPGNYEIELLPAPTVRSDIEPTLPEPNTSDQSQILTQ